MNERQCTVEKQLKWGNGNNDGWKAARLAVLPKDLGPCYFACSVLPSLHTVWQRNQQGIHEGRGTSEHVLHPRHCPSRSKPDGNWHLRCPCQPATGTGTGTGTGSSRCAFPPRSPAAAAGPPLPLPHPAPLPPPAAHPQPEQHGGQRRHDWERQLAHQQGPGATSQPSRRLQTFALVWRALWGAQLTQVRWWGGLALAPSCISCQESVPAHCLSV